jgi:hypothetical protein
VADAVQLSSRSMPNCQYSRLLPIHGRINKVYHTQVVKGALHHLRSRSSGQQVCERRPWPIGVSNNPLQSSSCISYYVWGLGNGLARCANVLLPIGNRCLPVSYEASPFPTAPVNLESLSPNSTLSSIPTVTEVPDERHPKT